ncbi:unnamed protein product [Candidula unifasciata]|uniref:Uncharacterized protein n=1 Tax=Candidula unifasciata TaxID=100452 RepID=A0A8S4A6Z2_9EUPU|nr:unnamed protein product [Candidula unifasciata]
MFTADSDRSASTISPLSSNICSSMVSSIYETSMNTPGGESDAVPHVEGGDAGPDSADGIQALVSTAVVMFGSSCSSSEDLPSIYDHPRESHLSSRKKPHTKHKEPSSQRKITSEVNGLAEGSSVCVPEMQPDSQGGSVTRTYPQANSNISQNVVLASNSAEGEYDEDNDSDEGEEEDLVPKYAFHHLNHRLTLYLMMSLFGTDEEFDCKLQGEVVQYIVEKSYEGLLVMSSARFYILKITSEDHSQPPDHWLHCVEIQPIPELRYIDVGLGGQTFRLEFVTDCSSYTFVTRNHDKTVQFVELLHTNLAKYAVSQGIASHVVVSDDIDEATLNNLDRDVVSKLAADQRMLHYCMGFIERGNQKLFPVSFVITTSDICLVCANLQWPQPRLQAAISEETVGKQFTVLERQKVSNVAAAEVCETTMKKIRLELFNETEGTSTSWNITLASKQSTVDFINALSQPWAKEFGVDMDVVYADLPF